MDLWKPNDDGKRNSFSGVQQTFFVVSGQQRLGPFFNFMEAIKVSRGFYREAVHIEYSEEKAVILRSYEPAF